MNSYCLDVETFISEVKKYPEIWDLNCEDNRHKSKKQRAWIQIARVFISKFDDLPDTEKTDVYRKLTGRWRNIRDSFVRHLKKKDCKRGYMYATHLAFLNVLYKPSSDSDEDEHNQWTSDHDDKIKRVTFKRDYDLLEDSSIWPSDTEDSTIENIKRKRGVQRNEIEYVDAALPDASCSFQIEDEDRSFFESLLPAVRGFDVDQKLEFRSEVITVIKNIRSKAQKFKLDPESGDF